MKIQIPDYKMEYYRVISSTQDRIKEILSAGPERTVVIAERQLAGRGRRDRKWESPEGGIYISVLTEFSCRKELLSIMALLAVLKALPQYSDISWKWPNDIYYNGKKAGGILTEVMSSGWVGIGIGINLSQSSKSLPLYISHQSACIDIESRERFTNSFLKHCTDLFKKESLAGDEKTLLEKRNFLLNKRVRSGMLEGIVKGINRAGELEIVTVAGNKTVLNTGSIHILQQ
ncbi:biotin--[acetyl-CoA-carboxylase] ligase, partial [Elusimicrobiota bacterium]